MFKQLQKVGKAFMLPIAILPAAGLLLGIGGALSNPVTVSTYPFLDIGILQALFKLMAACGEVVFANLASILAVGLAVGLAKRDQGTAGLAAFVGFFVMNAAIKSLLGQFAAEGASIDTGVIGSIAIGTTTAYIHNKYHNIQLPQVLGFFGGSRFVPIATSFVSIFIGAIFFFIWPPFQTILKSTGDIIASAGAIGTFFYGFLMRLSGAVGLHHIIYPMFWYSELGGVELVQGIEVVGAQKIFFAQLANPTHVGLYTEGTRFFAGRFATMMFGLPAAALAMYHCVPKEKRAKYSGLFLSTALTSFITGITEPLEYMFLFVQPLLYVFHSFLDGVSFYIADILNISIGNTFSGGVIDFTLFGVLQGNAKTHWLIVLPVGAAWAAIYYFSFRFLIKKFDIATPGRKDDDDSEIQKPTTKTSIQEEAVLVLAALGGAENLDDVDACITRLRVSVKNKDLVNKAELKRIGAIDVLEIGGGLQAIYGAKAILYKNAILEIMEK